MISSPPRLVDQFWAPCFTSPMPQIGSVPYLNALPLLKGLEESTGSKIIFDTPAGLHQAVCEGKVEVALLPVVSYLENPQLKLIPGTGISCRGEVKSVKVFHEKPRVDLFNTQRVYLDPDSLTSQRLLKILLIKKFNRDLEDIDWVNHPEAADSLLQIGDKALEKSHYGASQDLGLEWYDMTGLPFVFACWMSRGDITQEILTHLHNAKMRGKQCLEEIALKQKIVDPDDALEYLTRNIHYDIEGPELVGMKLFFDWVGELENQDYDTSLRFVA